MIMGIRQEIREYIDRSIVPLYDAFDMAHRRDHVLTVMSQAMELYSAAPEEIRSGIDPEMLLVAAACHDLGLVNGRENHHLDSGRIIRSDRHRCRDHNTPHGPVWPDPLSGTRGRRADSKG